MYKAILHDWKGYSDQLVAVKTLKGAVCQTDRYIAIYTHFVTIRNVYIW